jgi:hypothetical protein
LSDTDSSARPLEPAAAAATQQRSYVTCVDVVVMQFLARRHDADSKMAVILYPGAC